MGKIYTVVSGKGGAGKSTFCAGVSRACEKLNKKVLLIDGSIGFRSLDYLLGVDSMVVYDWLDYIKGNCDFKKPLLFEGEWINLLPAPIDLDDTFSKDDFKHLLDAYSEYYDLIFIDTPTGINDLSLIYSSLSDGVIAISQPDELSSKLTCFLGDELCKNGIKNENIRLVINKFSYRDCKRGRSLNIDDMIDKTYMRLLGIVPEVDDFSLKSEILSPTNMDLLAKDAFLNIINRLLGKDLPLIL